MARALIICLLMWFVISVFLYGFLSLLSGLFIIKDPVLVAEIGGILLTGFIVSRLG